MATYIDESGDTGSKPGSLPYFRLGAVWLPTLEEVEACRASIRDVRLQLNLSERHEFKFAGSGHHPDQRRAFFRAAMQHEFRFVVASYGKRGRQGDAIPAQGIHWACAVTLAAYLRATYQGEESRRNHGRTKPALLKEVVTVDDNEDGNFLAVVKDSFRALASGRQPGERLVGKVRFRGSRPDELLQVVDMVVGACGAHIDGDGRWYKLIAERCLGLVELPEMSAGRGD